MIDRISKWVSDVITGTRRSEPKNATSDNETKIKNDDIINKKDKLRSAVLAVLKANYCGESISFDERVLIIWISNQLFCDSVENSDFTTELTTSLFDELGYTFKSIEIRFGMPDEKEGPTKLLDDACLQIATEMQPQAQEARKAKISAIEGSTEEPYYILDSVEMQDMPDMRYNIGTYRRPNIPSVFRENQIAIDGDENSAHYERNKFVSRSHAHITYCEGIGFMLNVEVSGTRMAEKRTRILRGGLKIDMNNPEVPEPLQDKDIIELSKSVLLLFEEL